MRKLRDKRYKITDEEILDIYTSKEPREVVAKRYNISKKHVSSIRTGKTNRKILAQYHSLTINSYETKLGNNPKTYYYFHNDDDIVKELVVSFGIFSFVIDIISGNIFTKYNTYIEGTPIDYDTFQNILVKSKLKIYD